MARRKSLRTTLHDQLLDFQSKEEKEKTCHITELGMAEIEEDFISILRQWLITKRLLVERMVGEMTDDQIKICTSLIDELLGEI